MKSCPSEKLWIVVPFGMDAAVRHRAMDDALDSALLYRHLMEKLIINR